MTTRDRVLVVEDDPEVASTLSHMLQHGGFDVPRVAASGEEALRFFDEVVPDIVLVDIALNGPMDGVELAQAICQIRPTALMFVTGMADLRTRERVSALGAFTFMLKPVTPQQLRHAAELALSRFRAEQRLIAERDRAQADFRLLFDSAPDAVVMLDARGRILLANAEIERRFGYTCQAIVGEPIDVLLLEAFYPPAEPLELFGAPPGTRRMGELTPLTARRADGSECPVEISLTPTGAGPDLRTIAVIRDVSDRQLFRKVSDERRLLAEQVERVVRLEAVGRLAGGVAHDFNNMLTVVSGYTDSLLHDDLDDEARRQLLRGIRTTTDRAVALTRQLLAFGRRQVLQPKVVDLAAVLQSMHGMLGRVVGESFHLALVSGPDVKPVSVDPTQVEQVVLNLVVNARDSMSEGGTITIETRNVDIAQPLPLPFSVAVAPAGAYVMLSVRDTGVGMDRVAAARAFEPFFTTKEAGKGTGLGLSTVYGIVKQSGGFVWIDSTPGIGTRVDLLLPQAEGTLDIEEPMLPTSVIAQGAGTVLLVEDEPDVRHLLFETLTRAGYSVVAASDGREAIASFESGLHAVDVIVTDVVMPHGSGPSLVRAARAHRPGLKVLYISGYAAEGTASEVGEDADTRFLQKPFSRDQLLQRISQLLSVKPDTARTHARPPIQG